jgi:hypothetical protein
MLHIFFKNLVKLVAQVSHKDNQFEMEGVENSSLSFSHKKGTFFSLVPIETHAVFLLFFICSFMPYFLIFFSVSAYAA